MNVVSELLDHWVEQGKGDAPCILSDQGRWTYRELAAQVNRIANVLTQTFGMKSGHRVLLRSANTPMLVAAYLAIICVLPEILISQYSVPFYFGGTSLLIVVSVTMDTVAQVHSHLIAHQYEGLIKKAKLKPTREGAAGRLAARSAGTVEKRSLIDRLLGRKGG